MFDYESLHIFEYVTYLPIFKEIMVIIIFHNTDGSCLSWIFWEHENLSDFKEYFIGLYRRVALAKNLA